MLKLQITYQKWNVKIAPLINNEFKFETINVFDIGVDSLFAIVF